MPGAAAVLHSGMLTERVGIEDRTAQDVAFGVDTEWETRGTRWAGVFPMTPEESHAFMGDDSVVPYKVVFRGAVELDRQTSRLSWQGEKWRVTKMRRRFLRGTWTEFGMTPWARETVEG